VRAERIALVDQHRLGPEPLADPVGEQEVVGHVVVDEADAEDPDRAGGDERDRRRQGRDPGGAEGSPRRAVAAAAGAEIDHGSHHQRPVDDGDRCAAAVEPGDYRRRDQQRREAHRAGEPGPLPRAAGEEDRLTDRQRARGDQRRRGQRGDHQQC
jgi:hypothetical protein